MRPRTPAARAQQRRHRQVYWRSRQPQDCKGWNYHVRALGSDECSICGKKPA